MITRIKVFGRSVLRGVNALVGSLLSVTDLRGGDTIAGVETIELTKPVTTQGRLEGLHHNLFNTPPYWVVLFNKGVNMPALFILKLDNARMVGRGVIVYKNKVLLESAIFQREYLNKLMANNRILLSRFKNIKTVQGKAIPLLNKLSNNFYHWTTESLSRLAVLLEYGNETYTDYDIIIAADSPAFVSDSLKVLFKVPAEKIRRWKNNEMGMLEESILISYPFIRTPETAMTNFYNPSLYKLLNNVSLRNVPSISNEAEYIIISRHNATERRLINEEKLMDAFPSLPLKTIYIEKMGMAEQIRMFRHAKLIISPHGAGLVNLVYVTNNPVVIELFPSTRKIRDASLFVQISREIDIQYHLLVKEPFNNHQDIEITDNIVAEIKGIISTNQL